MEQMPSESTGLSASPRVRRTPRLTERDLMLLAFVAEHRIVLASHVQALLGVSARSAQARMHALKTAGLLDQETVWHHRPACYSITRKGLGLVGKGYATRPIDPSVYDHDVGVAWLWLVGLRGYWGEMRKIVSERQMRSADAAPDRPAEPFGVRLGGFGPSGRPRLHYPDLLLVTPEGRRIAVELELTRKGRTRLEKILTGYAVDRRIDAVLYLTDDPSVARGVEASASRLGITSLVSLQRVAMNRSPAARTTVRDVERDHAAPSLERSRRRSGRAR
jgi:hypothetical protein